MARLRIESRKRLREGSPGRARRRVIRDILVRAISDGAALLQQCLDDPTFVEDVAHATRAVADALSRGNKVMVCGNGGSLADAAHFAEEFSGRFRSDRRPLPVMAFADAMHMSCVANDYGFEYVFSRMVQAFGKPGDVLLLLTTSGNSENLVLAAKAAQEHGVLVIGFSGRGGGRLAASCSQTILAPGETSDRIQEVQMLCLHALIEAVEAELGV